MEQIELAKLTTDIVCAHVNNNPTKGDEIASLITSVFFSLSKLGQPDETPLVEPSKPKVSIRSSIKGSKLICLDCGLPFASLKRHLGTAHGMSPDDYRAKWKLPADYPIVAPEYSAMRAVMAKSIGLGRKPGAGRKKGGAPKQGKASA